MQARDHVGRWNRGPDKAGGWIGKRDFWVRGKGKKMVQVQGTSRKDDAIGLILYTVSLYLIELYLMTFISNKNRHLEIFSRL